MPDLYILYTAFGAAAGTALVLCGLAYLWRERQMRQTREWIDLQAERAKAEQERQKRMAVDEAAMAQIRVEINPFEDGYKIILTAPGFHAESIAIFSSDIRHNTRMLREEYAAFRKLHRKDQM